MLAKTGNLTDAFNEAWRTLDIAERVERMVNSSPTAHLEAEVSEASANWYLVNTFPGDGLKAMRQLARRRFGVFRPMQQRKVKRHEDQQIGVMEPVFPDWLFVFCWDINKMRSRILGCPGVRSILCNPVTLVPVTIPDAFVQDVRSLSWIFEERLTHVGRSAARHEKRPPKLQKKQRKALEALKKALKRTNRFDPSTWAQASELAPEKRIALLKQALLGPAVDGCASLRDEAS